MREKINKSFFIKLKDGDFGLAKTYWLYGVVVNLILSIPTYVVSNLSLLIVLTIIGLIYGVIVLIGIWNSASRYEGLKLWAILAKLATILGFITIILTAVGLLYLFQA
jgi:hypothetical protein